MSITQKLEFQFDQSGLDSQECIAKNETFENLYEIEATKANCELVQEQVSVPNCSLALYHGMKSGMKYRFKTLPLRNPL